MTLHDLVDQYLNTYNVLQAFSGHFVNGEPTDLEFIESFKKLEQKFNNLGNKIMSEYTKEDPLTAVYELERAMDRRPTKI